MENNLKNLPKCISIDCRMVNASGIGTYIKNTIPKVITELSCYKFYLLGSPFELDEVGFTKYKNVDIIKFISPIYSIGEQLYLKKIIPAKTDLFWAPHYNFPLFYKGKLLVSIMDVGHLAMNQINHEWYKRLYATIMFKKIKKNADITIYISNFSKNEFNKYIGKPTTPQIVTLLGVGKEWFNISNSTGNLREKPYLLFVGNVKPHKNLKSLINAFISIKDKIPHDLIIVGKKEGFITADPDINEIAKKNIDRIFFTGKVEDSELKQYFNQADVFVFPSIYEGFGLPPLEAMAAKIPVVASNAASIPEICGDSVLYFNPFDEKDIAKKILRMIQDENLKKDYIKKGIENSRRYSWEKTGQKTVEIIKNLLI